MQVIRQNPQQYLVDQFLDSVEGMTVEQLQTLRPVLSLSAHFDAAKAGRKPTFDDQMAYILQGRSTPGPITMDERATLRAASPQESQTSTFAFTAK